MNSVHRVLLFLKKIIYPVLITALSLIIIYFLLYINEIVISIRLNELKSYLQDADHNEGGIDHIALIATYEIHKKVYEERITQDTADAIENKISILSLPGSVLKSKDRDIYNMVSYPALFVINFNRKILGKVPVSYKWNRDDEFKELDKAYYCERNFLYKQAITHYGKALENGNLNPGLASSIILRQGYCYALAGYSDKALKNYQTVIADYSQESSAITASILMRYLEGFTLARNRVMLDSSDPIMKSQRLVNLLAYEHALKIINTIEHKAGSKDLPRIQYYKARCLSGLGQPEKAVENYLKVVTSAPDSAYAKYANRKIFSIGASAGGDNKLLDISKSINKKLNDPVLNRMIENQGKTGPVGGVIADLIRINIPAKIQERIKRIPVMYLDPEEIDVMIITSDGITYKGKLLEKSSDKISIQTSIGRIDLNNNEIKNVKLFQ